MKASERKRERHHAELRTLEAEIRNTLDGVDALVKRVQRAATARDCKTARLNFDQADLAFKAIGKKLNRAAQLHKALRLGPGVVGHTSTGIELAAPAGQQFIEVEYRGRRYGAKVAAGDRVRTTNGPVYEGTIVSIQTLEGQPGALVALETGSTEWKAALDLVKVDAPPAPAKPSAKKKPATPAKKARSSKRGR